MDAVNDPSVDAIAIMSSAQVGKTEIINNVCGFYIQHDPAPILVVEPTREMAQAWSKDRLAPMVRDTPSLKSAMPNTKSKDSGNTIFHKRFPGGHLTITGANSAAGLAARPIRIVLLDEVDRYPPSAGAEGDPVSLARKRSTTFWNRKIVMASTPTIKDESRIEAEWLESDQRRFFVPCPDCGEYQILRWSGVRWDDDDRSGESAVYVCDHCGSLWDDFTRWQAVRAGEWRATEQFNGKAGFHLNEIYSPWVRLAEMVAAFIEAKKLPETLKTFINTSLGETWEDRGDTVDGENLKSRGEPYTADDVPEGVIVVTAGVDVQDDRLEYEFVGWGKDFETWGLGEGSIFGDPSTADLWDRLEDTLLEKFYREDGATLSVAAACIDSGGHHTQSVYNFCKPKARQVRRWWCIKGQGGPGKPIWPGKPSRNNKGRVPLWLLGVDAAKEHIFSRLTIDEPGAGYCHFPESYPPEFYDQLTGEKRITVYRMGRPYPQWRPKTASQRVEALDRRVYAYAAFIGLNPKLDRVNERLIARIKTAGERQDDKNQTVEPEQDEAPATPARSKRRRRTAKRRGGFVSKGKF